jgi:hypothetical protein
MRKNKCFGKNPLEENSKCNMPFPRICVRFTDRDCAAKGPSTLAFCASVIPSAMAAMPNSFLCAITYVIAREKQKKLLGIGAIADGVADAQNASVDGP